jgi:hypothetical protein
MTAQEAIDLLDTLDGMIEDNHNSDYDSAFKMAIEALEKQIPKKVVDMIHRPNGFYGKYQVCGCSNARMQFCQRCGHKLDWSEQNERT